MKTAPVLLLIPPFTQMNTPYPSTAYLKGYLNTKGIASEQMDLSLEVILAIFSAEGMTALFAVAKKLPKGKLSANGRTVLSQSTRYVQTIPHVVAFLQGQSDTLAYSLCNDTYLPRAGRFTQDEEEMEWAFGSLGMRDKARYLATCYLEDLSDFIQETVDPDFGFSRYAEHLGRCASSFDEIAAALSRPLSFTDNIMLRLFEKRIMESRPSVVALSVPFPGNLYSALRCAEWLKRHCPELPVVMGGGFANTELRQISDTRLFQYIDYLLLDDGEDPLHQLLLHLQGKAEAKALVRTYCLDDSRSQIIYHNDPTHPHCQQSETGTPDYSGLLLDKYISVIEVTNPMHKLWSDGRWNKLTLAHGCYWGKCAFCDGSLDYIGRYEPNTAVTLVDRMEELITATGERGFHFVDEAAPPALLRELANEIIRRGLTVSWWGNIRFEKSFTAELCQLLRSSGCIAVSGGLEVASPRLLSLINKGVTVPQVARVAGNFTETGIMVHAYLMYGFPTETAQETIDSLEVVRQLFELGLVQSGFWHRFAMTAHSPVGLSPANYHCRITEPPFGGFARNDLRFEDETGCRHELYGEGLRTSLYNYMNGTGFDLPLHKWFAGFKVPRTTIPPNYIEKIMSDLLTSRSGHSV
ncbi:MAG: radical SAM protein [Tannerellaceae bacterium]